MSKQATPPKFPLFTDLSAKRVLVVGGGRVALRRIKTLLQFGAAVTAVAKEFKGEAALRARIELHEREFKDSDINGAYIVTAATNDRAVNHHIYELCVKRGIPVSTADAQSECTYYFPAVCMGGGLCAGVVSGGSNHTAVSAAAKKIRELLNPPLPQASRAEYAIPPQQGGKVTLVGAGAGDMGLLTLRGKAALENAEVVVYDRLIGKEILALIPDTAEKINAGKKSSNHLIPQNEINEILIQKAAAGKRVVRLKGGDSYLFGRGGEELTATSEAGIEFEVVPGVSSAIAVPAYAGIPVTHRDIASSLHIITAHAKAGKPLEIDFDACTKIGGTLVFLMGVASMGKIADGLLGAGMSADMPCAVIENGTLPNQRKYLGKLGELTEFAKTAKAPAIIVIGEVCALSEKLDFIEKRPLRGLRIAVTRPQTRTSGLSAILRERGAETIDCPVIKPRLILDSAQIRESADALRDAEWTVFTSPSGVSLYFDALNAQGLDARVFGNTKIAAVGKATADELLKHGLRADLTPKHFSGADLGESLYEAGAKNALLLRADKCAPDLTDKLTRYGIAYKEIAVYHTDYVSETDLTAQINAGEIDFVTFTSASTVKAFVNAHKSADLSKITGVCIGEKTAEAAKANGIAHICAENATLDAMAQCIEQYIRERKK